MPYFQQTPDFLFEHNATNRHKRGGERQEVTIDTQLSICYFSNVKRKRGSRGPKPLGIDIRVIVTLDEATRAELEQESDISKMRITEIGRAAIKQYLAEKKKERAGV